MSASERSSGYDRSGEVIRIEDCDAEWEIALDNREFKLALAPRGRTFDSALPPEELPGVISYFAAEEEYRFDTGYVTGMNKNTVAVDSFLQLF